MRDRSQLLIKAVAWATVSLLLASESAWAFGLRLQSYCPLSRCSRSGNVIGCPDLQQQPYQTHHRIRTTLNVQMEGDPLREATGIRPSLHPTTINAIAEALKARARRAEGMHFQVSNNDDNGTVVRPIDVAVTAGKIASTAITNRRTTSEGDGMKLTPEEEHTIAGRVLGVVMRLENLEKTLQERVSAVDWVQKYNEWSTFGVLHSEGNNEKDLSDRIKADPLFAVSRAECLLAIFLGTIERPQLEKVGENVPDGSKIDFLDSDRMEVLLLPDTP